MSKVKNNLKLKFKRNFMNKLIELTPEWVLTELSQSLYADGNGIVSIDKICQKLKFETP